MKRGLFVILAVLYSALGLAQKLSGISLPAGYVLEYGHPQFRITTESSSLVQLDSLTSQGFGYDLIRVFIFNGKSFIPTAITSDNYNIAVNLSDKKLYANGYYYLKLDLKPHMSSLDYCFVRINELTGKSEVIYKGNATDGIITGIRTAHQNGLIFQTQNKAYQALHPDSVAIDLNTTRFKDARDFYKHPYLYLTEYQNLSTNTFFSRYNVETGQFQYFNDSLYSKHFQNTLKFDFGLSHQVGLVDILDNHIIFKAADIDSFGLSNYYSFNITTQNIEKLFSIRNDNDHSPMWGYLPKYDNKLLIFNEIGAFNPAERGTLVWQTDGTAANTMILDTITAEEDETYQYIDQNTSPVIVNRKLLAPYIAFWNGNIRPRLASIDLNTNTLTPDITAEHNFNALEMGAFLQNDNRSNCIFFKHNRDIWSSNGTLAGTKKIVDLSAYTNISMDDIFIFSSYNDTVNIVINKSDTSSSLFQCGCDGGLIDDLNTGLIENDYNIQYSVYPNPTQGLVYLDNKITISAYHVYDLQGREVISNTGNHLSYIDLTELVNGMYIVHLQSDRSINKVKLIKN